MSSKSRFIDPFWRQGLECHSPIDKAKFLWMAAVVETVLMYVSIAAVHRLKMEEMPQPKYDGS